MRELLLVFAAGGLGSACRYLCGLGLAAAPGTLPWATLLVNAVGALLIGAALEWATRFGLAQAVLVTLTTGFLGGFTTFSAFAAETVLLAQTRAPLAIAYVLGTLVCGLAGVLAGQAAVRLLG